MSIENSFHFVSNHEENTLKIISWYCHFGQGSKESKIYNKSKTWFQENK